MVPPCSRVPRLEVGRLLRLLRHCLECTFVTLVVLALLVSPVRLLGHVHSAVVLAVPSLARRIVAPRSLARARRAWLPCVSAAARPGTEAPLTARPVFGLLLPLVDGVLVSWETQACETRDRVWLSWHLDLASSIRLHIVCTIACN
jgi:hypothetical protein